MYDEFGPKPMPRIDVDAVPDLSEKERAVVRLIDATRGDDAGTLRRSKPAIKANDPLTGLAAYVWRMVAFSVSPIRQHQCMPVTADFDLPDAELPAGEHKFGARRELAKQWDVVVDKVIHCIPKSEWHGVRTWGHALYGR
jgi:hypothetical protein